MGIEVRLVEGKGWEPTKTFNAGVPSGPFSVGAQGEWTVSAPSTAPLHAYLYFDGQQLFVAAVEPELPTSVNGAPASTAWTPVPLPGEIQIGGAKLAASDDGIAAPPMEIEDAKTAFFGNSPAQGGPLPAPGHRAAGSPPQQAAAPPAPRHSGGRPLAEAGDESTKFLPIEQMRRPGPAGASGPYPAQPDPGPGPEAAPGQPPGAAPLFSGPNPFPFAHGSAPPGQQAGFSGQPGPQPQASPAPGGAPGQAKSGPLEAWRSASLPRKLTYVLLPVALVWAAMSMLQDDAPAAKAPAKAAASGSARPRASASAPAASSSAAPSADTSPAMPASSTTGALLPAAPRPSASSAKPLPPPRPGKEPEKTVERKAVDAVAAGNYPEALRLYEQLAAEHPEVPAFREAVRVLKSRGPLASVSRPRVEARGYFPEASAGRGPPVGGLGAARPDLPPGTK